jgi:hypothetical protein
MDLNMTQDVNVPRQEIALLGNMSGGIFPREDGYGDKLIPVGSIRSGMG